MVPNSMLNMVSEFRKQRAHEDVEWLSQPSTEEEVRFAFFGMNPGLDDILAIFCRNLWDIIGNDVTKKILETLHSGRLLKQINHTFIYLILEIPNLDSFSQYCPISLLQCYLRRDFTMHH